MEGKSDYIFFNNIVVKVSSIDTVERTDDNRLIVSLDSGRCIENKYPDAETLDKHQKMFLELLNPTGFDVVPVNYDEINAAAAKN